MRERLLDALGATLERPLTVVSAPAGYGKSVLVSDWSRSLDIPVAWVVLDETESELSQFLAYFLAALDSVYPGAFEAARHWLANPDLPSPQTIASDLINVIVNVGRPVVLVLDDYHQIDHGSAVHELFDAILKYPPANFHLVLVTRRDPPLALTKLKANNQLTELRLSDLQFSDVEASQVLCVALGEIPVSTWVRDLQERVEGWAAGLRMVALAAGRLRNPIRTQQAVPTGLREIQEYLLQEVIEDLPAKTQYLLLYSAIPEKFCAGLLDNVSQLLPGGSEGGAELDGVEFIRRAEHNNMFIIALDADGTWYRYHHLFRELLLQQLQLRLPGEELASKQTRIALWLEELGLLDDAIRVYLDAGQPGEAAGVVERHRVQALDEDRWLQVNGWLQLFSPDETRNWPGTLLARAWIGHFHIDAELISDLVQQLEMLEGAHGLTAFQLGELDYFRALPLFWSGDIAGARFLWERADKAPLGYGTIQGQLQVYLALSRAMEGERERALNGIQKLRVLDAGKRGTLASRLAAVETQIHYISLSTAPAAQAAARLAMLSSSDFKSMYARGWANFNQGLIHFNTARFPEAIVAFDRARESGSHMEYQARIDLLAGKVICHALLGEWEEVNKVLSQLEALACPVQLETTKVEILASIQARAALCRADLKSAVAIARGLPDRPAAGCLFIWLEEPAISRIRVDLARGKRAAASRALKAIAAIRQGTVAQHLLCQDIDLMLLEALGREQLGAREEALALLEEALGHAVPANWSRPFIELGDSLGTLLPHCSLSEENLGFLSLQCGIKVPAQPVSAEQETVSNHAQLATASREHFTNRELDILELLAQRFRNKEIASQLYISTHTVNYHLKHIYQKLDVSGRRKAVARAIELGVMTD